MMTKPADTRQGRDAADASADLGRLAAGMLQEPSAAPLHSLMAHPAAAFAAATAIGFGFSTQMAGAFWGALQGAVEATNRFAAALEEQKDAPSVVAPQPVSTIDGAGDAPKPVKAAPAADVKAAGAKARRKPVTAPVAAEAPAAVKIAPVKAKAASGVKASAGKVAAREKTVARGRRPAAGADDLKQISGIGPKLESVLQQRSIRSFADIASWSDADVARIDAELGFEGRIGRDDWVGQARRLLAPKEPGRK